MKISNYKTVNRCILSVFVAILITTFQLTKCSRTEDNPLNSKRADIDIISENGAELDTITRYIKRDINILVSVLFPDELDSISYQTGNGPYGRFSEEELSKDLDITISFDIPCTTKVLVTGYKNGIPVTSDSTVLYVTEENNQPPTLKLKPFRLYAAPCLPCTIKVSVFNPEIWQQVNLSCEITMDSLFIWTPGTEIIGNTVMVNLTAIDNGLNPDSAKDSVLITVIADSSLPPTPVNFKVDMRTDSFVAISWNKDPLADSYILYRSVYGNDSISEEIRVSDTSYIDSTSITYFYRISAANFFGISNPSDIIYGIDTVNYRQRVFFTDSGTTAFESDSFHTIRIQVAKQATDNINVWYTLKSSSADTSDFRNVSYSSLIPSGDTSGICTLIIVNDNLKEEIEYFTVSLDSVSHGFISGRNILTVSIVDDDTLFTIIYNENGATAGEIPVDQNSYKQNAYATVLGNNGQLAKTGYSFAGWRTSSDTSGKEFKPGDTLRIGATCIRLYAQWTANKYTVRYNRNGGEYGTEPDSGIFDYGTLIEVSDKGGLGNKFYTFTGWNTLSDGSGDTLMPGDTFNLEASDITLYAQWKISPPVITQQPSGDTLRAGNSYRFTVSAVGIGDISYQWKKDGEKISGATSSTYSIDTVTRNDSATYQCIVNNSSGSVSSNSVLLNVICVAAVSAGGSHTMIIMTDGTLWRTGDNYYGQLGNETYDKDSIPLKVMSGVASVYTGMYHTMILKKDGTLWATGNNGYGQLGFDNTLIPRINTPTFLTSDVHSVSTKSDYTMVLKNDGSLWGTGSNGYGQLGNGTKTDISTLVEITSGVSSVSAGYYHTMILKGGNLYATGNNYNGQLGDGTNTDILSLFQVETSVSSVSAGGNYTMILKSGGLYATGQNNYGQLGNGTMQDTTSFIQVASGVSSVSTGDYHTMIIKNDGTLWATGYNFLGQLGIGNTSDYDKTSYVKIMTDVLSVSAGGAHTMIIKKDGTLWATGYNYNGQLGTGNTISVTSPVLVAF